MHPEDDHITTDLTEFNNLQEFVRDACPSSWLEYAEELRDAAELLWAHEGERLKIGVTLNADYKLLTETGGIAGVSRTYMLLAGFSLENLIKGCLVFADPSHVNRGVLSSDLKSHDIVVLASKIPDLDLSNGERQFCEIASKAIPYWGRYPSPLKKGQLLPEVGVDELLRKSFLGLFERLAHRLYWEVRNGWDSGVGPKTLKVRSLRYGDKIDPKEPFF